MSSLTLYRGFMEPHDTMLKGACRRQASFTSGTSMHKAQGNGGTGTGPPDNRPESRIPTSRFPRLDG